MNIHVGDSGTVIEITIQEEVDGELATRDISDATTKQFVFVAPDKSKFTKDATFFTDGKDGILRYLSEADDFTQPGMYMVQAYLELTDWTGHSGIKSFMVEDTLSRQYS